MINTLYLPELREMLASGNEAELREFCIALHPARLAEFMEGLTANEAWEVLKYADPPLREQIFSYFELDKRVSIVEDEDRQTIAELIAELPPDDRVDLLDEVSTAVVDELLPLLPADERHDILRLRAYPDESAGAIMTTEVAKFDEMMTVADAMQRLAQIAAELETLNYLYIVDDHDHLRGVLSVRQLVSQLGHPETNLAEVMDTDMVVCEALDDQEEVAKKVARYDLLAIPVVDDRHELLGIITHDDVIDVLREEATEDAHRAAAVDPLEDSYLRTHLLTLSWKRGIWLTILFFAALLTALILEYYDGLLHNDLVWLAWFVPLVISSGGNSGAQSATLIITGMATGDISLTDWFKVVRRELMMGLILGGFLALVGFFFAWMMRGSVQDAVVVPVTVLLVVICGTLCGSVLPLIFKRLGWDPALMSNPFVAGIIDIVGIAIYMNVALVLM